MKPIPSALRWAAGALVLLAAGLTPLLWPGLYDGPIILDRPTLLTLRGALALAVPLLTWLGLRGAQLPVAEKRVVFFACLVAASVCEVVHYWVIDRGHYFPASQFKDNTAWQLYMNEGILALRPEYLPHSYRFLPDCLVRILAALVDDFAYARILYRMTCNGLLFVTIFRFARLHVRTPAACGVVVGLVALYPVTVLKYAGQFVDPLSHLSFAACLLFLAEGREAGFAASLVVGLFAKESVFVMAFCRAFHGPRWFRSVAIAIGYALAGSAVVFGIRLFVNHGSFAYGQVSGVGPGHLWNNLAKYPEWGPLYLVSLGALLPGAIAGWRLVDRALRWTTITLVLAMIGSSLLFSWLHEVRNLMPAFIVLAVINARYLEHLFSGANLPIAAGRT